MEATKYKDSGIPWIGEIPSDWEVRRARDTVSIIRGGSPRPIEDYISGNNEGYNWIKIGDTIKGSKYIVSTKSKIIEEGLNKTRFVHKDDLILTNSMSFGEPYILKIDGCIHDGWVAFSNYKDITKEFLYYLLISPLCRLQFEQQVAGGVVQNLNIDKIGTTLILLPPLPTQQRIADFLDRKCAEIDELAALQETMIAELKRYKQSVITEAVTKGLDPNVPMQDSNIPWIGEIPNHWIKCSVKQIMKNKSIKGYPNEQVLSLYRDWGVLPKDSRDDNHNVTSEDTSSYKLVDVGDFVLNKMKAWQGSMAVSKYRGIISPAYYICSFVDDNIYRNYFHYLLRNETYKVEYRRLSTGLRIGQWDLNIDDFLHIPIVVPPLIEQRAIADYLDKKCGEIDELIAIKQQKIEALKEYKKSVIFEYVTGKKEVLSFRF